MSLKSFLYLSNFVKSLIITCPWTYTSTVLQLTRSFDAHKQTERQADSMLLLPFFLQINTGKKSCDMEPMSKFCDPVYNIYKIPWALLIGQTSTTHKQSSMEHPKHYSQSSVETNSTNGAGSFEFQISSLYREGLDNGS